MIALLVVGALAGLAWAAFGGSDDDPRPDHVADDPGVSHVHGLGVNPADGSLIVATHYGTFRIPADSDEAIRIGDSFQDTMGFTVVGPDRFYGSGHPDLAGMQAGQPGSLGLIESTNAGETWANVSLSGRVDFHGLAFAHGHVYGWDSGTQRFMVSADGKEWENRSTLPMYGFAVDPDDGEHVIAATPDGLASSTDGGRTWTGGDGPPLRALSWDAAAGLWGADGTGGVWHSTQGGWVRAGTLPGPAQALLATPDGLYAAAGDGSGATGIYRSTDDGETWQLRYRDEHG